MKISDEAYNAIRNSKGRGVRLEVWDGDKRLQYEIPFTEPTQRSGFLLERQIALGLEKLGRALHDATAPD